MPEGEPRFEEEKPKEIRDAASFNELYDIITKKWGLRPSEKHVKDLILKIKNMEGRIDNYAWHGVAIDPLFTIKNFQKELEEMPTRELRDKVSELLYKKLESKNESMIAAQKENIEKNRKKDEGKQGGK